jgi:hypothetical protein
MNLLAISCSTQMLHLKYGEQKRLHPLAFGGTLLVRHELKPLHHVRIWSKYQDPSCGYCSSSSESGTTARSESGGRSCLLICSLMSRPSTPALLPRPSDGGSCMQCNKVFVMLSRTTSHTIYILKTLIPYPYLQMTCFDPA